MKGTTIKVEGPLLAELERAKPPTLSLTAFVRSVLEREVRRRKMLESAERYTEFLRANDDGTFKSAKELEKLYAKEHGLKRRGTTIAYCRIGERSSHTWFVLHYLLGFPKVKNYDGSWTEWGNTVGVPIEKGMPQPKALVETAGGGS